MCNGLRLTAVAISCRNTVVQSTLGHYGVAEKRANPACNIPEPGKVCMYVCLMVALLCYCVHGMGQHQLGRGERSFKEVLSYFPDRMSKPGLRHTIGWHAANFYLGHRDWAEKP